MSRLGDQRAAIVGALEAAGVPVAEVGGRIAAPCVLVEPGDPWSEPVRLPGRVTRWRLSAIAGAADTLAGLEELAELVDRVDGALRPALDGISLPTWAAPAVRELDDGVRRRSSLGSLTYQTT